MLIDLATVQSNIKLKENVYLLKVFSPGIAASILPGQFCNIKVNESDYPLLRRPFSICDVEGEFIFFLFNVHGEGTEILSRKKEGDIIDILGPLGKGFTIGKEKNAIIAAGGLGVAPFPFLIKKLRDKNIQCIIGGRTDKEIITYGLVNVNVSTDDGSLGFRGTAVDLLRTKLAGQTLNDSIIYSCGPNPMMKALQGLVDEINVKCEISIECAMACGFGICQGCPVEKSVSDDKYYLVCKDGPVFNAKDIVL